MSDYIKREDAVELLSLMIDRQDSEHEPYNVGVIGAINMVKHKVPSADVVERKRGEWNKPDYGMCSNCHKYAIETENGFDFTEYCPHCGASMREREGE